MAHGEKRWRLLRIGVSSSVQQFYVDPDFTGTPRDGTAAAPWQSLNDAQTPTPWDAINTALALTDVTVYFSARAAGSDVNQTSSVGLELNRTDTSIHRLTLDGMSKYNSNDAAPTWADYFGTSKFAITTSVYALNTNNDQAPYTHRDYITVRGIKLIATDQPIVIINAGQFIFEDNEGGAQAGATVGPGFIYQHRPLGDTNHANFSSGIVIRRNYIHHTFGEGIYISGNGGAGGAPPGDGTNTQTEDDILIEDNIIEHTGIYGGQGEGIDVKEGHTNLRIRGNMVDNAGNRGITAESADLIENNFVRNCGTNAIVTTSGYTNTWGRDRLVIQNNVVVAGPNTALKLDASDAVAPSSEWYNTKVLNNTFFKPDGTAADHVVMINKHHDVTFLNNIILGGNSTFQALWFENVTFVLHDNNLYFVRSSDFNWVVNSGVIGYDRSAIITWEPNSLAAEPLFTSEATPYVALNFKPLSTSPALGSGVAVSPAFPDYIGVLRPPWDIGAFRI